MYISKYWIKLLVVLFIIACFSLALLFEVIHLIFCCFYSVVSRQMRLYSYKKLDLPISAAINSPPYLPVSVDSCRIWSFGAVCFVHFEIILCTVHSALTGCSSWSFYTWIPNDIFSARLQPSYLSCPLQMHFSTSVTERSSIKSCHNVHIMYMQLCRGVLIMCYTIHYTCLKSGSACLILTAPVAGREREREEYRRRDRSRSDDVRRSKDGDRRDYDRERDRVRSSRDSDRDRRDRSRDRERSDKRRERDDRHHTKRLLSASTFFTSLKYIEIQKNIRTKCSSELMLCRVVMVLLFPRQHSQQGRLGPVPQNMLKKLLLLIVQNCLNGWPLNSML